MRLLAVFAAAAILTGCATYQPVPADYKGPVAVIADSGQPEDGTKAQMFVIAEVDGNRIPTSIGASAQASQGRGFSLSATFIDRKVPAKPMKVKLLATHTTAAPIHAMASQLAGTFYSVEGVVDFSPLPGGRYVVKGELKKVGSSVWIEDAVTNKVVTEKVVK